MKKQSNIRPTKRAAAKGRAAADTKGRGRFEAAGPAKKERRTSHGLAFGRVADDLDPSLIETVAGIAAKSAVAKQVWPDRVTAGIGYVKGMAVVFASFYQRLLAGDGAIAAMAKTKPGNPGRDVVAWYEDEFEALGMDNSEPSDVLRHLFVVMYGLGMKVSAGKYCKGHDFAATGTPTRDSAGAGLFQSTYDLRSAHPLLPKVIASYLRDPEGYLDLFREDVTCAPHDWDNHGSDQAMEFQRLSKACPAFAVEFAAIALRNRKDHWKAITLRQVRLLGNCDRMFRQVQEGVDRATGRDRGRRPSPKA